MLLEKIESVFPKFSANLYTIITQRFPADNHARPCVEDFIGDLICFNVTVWRLFAMRVIICLWFGREECRRKNSVLQTHSNKALALDGR